MVDDLRAMVRRILLGFVVLATIDDHQYDTSFFETELDSALLDSGRRDALRAAMDLA